jgi:hypothetical protein
MGNQCFKSQQDPSSFDTKRNGDKQKSKSNIQNSTNSSNLGKSDPNMKNPFKKKRGEGYVPPSQQP